MYAPSTREPNAYLLEVSSMFNSGILDVAIGLIFIYLLLSLIASAANEMIEHGLKNRASDLERGIRELLEDPDKPSSIVKDLYNHPLVNSLFVGKYHDPNDKDTPSPKDDKSAKPKPKNSNQLPSYIPARNFALALMDLAISGKAEGGAPAVQPAAGATGPATGAAAAAQEIARLRDALSKPNDVLPDRVRNALLALINQAGNDINKARESIEDWFNSAMDRVSGWYKRRSQLIVFVIGLLTAFAVNADSVLIAKRLAADKSLRESLTNAAEEYARVNASASPSPTPAGTATPTPTPTPTPGATPAATPSATATPNLAIMRTCPPPDCDDVDSPECKLKKSLCEIEGLGLPIGWEYENDPRRHWPGTNLSGVGGWVDQFYWHSLGWLLTALAVSLGAPFWFDLLNKFIVVRSTVKPKEKSPEEPSKD
jgi:hypothetical protein